MPLHAAREALEQELHEEAAKGHLQLDDAAREEYNRIKQEAGAKTSKLAQDLASLQTTQKACIVFARCVLIVFAKCNGTLNSH